MGYKIIGKHLYLNGEKVRLEFGNEEQIRFLKRHAELKEKFGGDGLELDVEVTTSTIISTSFGCICGEGWAYVDVDGDEDSDESEIIGLSTSCHKCGQKYDITENEQGDIVAKLKPE